MARKQNIAIRRVLSSVISKTRLERTAVEEGFVVRSRKVDAVAFFWTLVLTNQQNRGQSPFFRASFPLSVG